MRPSKEQLITLSHETGFRIEILEKVYYLQQLLSELCSHPFLKERVALKGGTALNLFYYDIPRLSVDIDLNYIGSAQRDIMLIDRATIQTIIQSIATHHDFVLERLPSQHAGGKFILRYPSIRGDRGELQVDINYIHRIPFLPLQKLSSCTLGQLPGIHNIPLLDIHEITAGKLMALLSRHKSRDLFDSALLAQNTQIDVTRLRLMFVVYCAMSNMDHASLSAAHINYEFREYKNQLMPMLSKTVLAQMDDKMYLSSLIEASHRLVAQVLPFSPQEQAFLMRLQNDKEIKPELLTDDVNLQKKIKEHPGILWQISDSGPLEKKRGYLKKMLPQKERMTDVASLLSNYAGRNCVHKSNTQDEAMGELLAKWGEERLQSPHITSLILAADDSQVELLNEGARYYLQLNGQLQNEQEVTTNKGIKAIAIGERIRFLTVSNELSIEPGMMATVQAINGNALTILVDDRDKPLSFDLKSDVQVDYGYAAKIEEMKERQVDHTYLLVSPKLDNQSTLIALSCHKSQMQIYWSLEDFPSYKDVMNALTREYPSDRQSHTSAVEYYPKIIPNGPK